MSEELKTTVTSEKNIYPSAKNSLIDSSFRNIEHQSFHISLDKSKQASFREGLINDK